MTESKESNNLWVLVDSERRHIHKTTDESNVTFMLRQVEHAKSVGDDWVILHYKLHGVIREPNQEET